MDSATAGKDLLGLPDSLPATDSVDAAESGLYIFSVQQSLKAVRQEARFETLRTHMPPEVLVEYAGDVDSIFTMLEEYLEQRSDDATFGINHSLTAEEEEKLKDQAMEWNDVFKAEVLPQARAVGLDFTRDGYGGKITPGDRLMVAGPKPHGDAGER